METPINRVIMHDHLENGDTEIDVETDFLVYGKPSQVHEILRGFDVEYEVHPVRED